MKKWIWVLGAFALALGMTLESPTSAMPECTPDVLDDGGIIHGQVYDAKPIEQKPARVKALLPKRTMGAKLYVRAEKGVTPAYLQRAAECHAKSRTSPSYQHDPLRVDGNIQSIRAYSAGGSLVLSVIADNPGTGREIWERAKALASEIDAGFAKTETQKAYD